MRFLFLLFVVLAGFLLLRSLLEPLVTAIVALLTPAAPPSHTTGSGVPPKAGELKKDPVCGTFVSPELAITQKFNGQIVHFCSKKCRDEYARTA